jgi:Fur family transcriptional regulator, ferric uptake regulator
MMNPSELLKTADLSITRPRLAVLEFFLCSSQPVSIHELYALSKESFDRVTVYRTLQVLLKKQVIRQVATSSFMKQYELRRPIDPHCGQHAHFVCHTCGKTYCLQDMPLPRANLPNGFVALQIALLVEGKCERCNNG